jgi:hypothetical protein
VTRAGAALGVLLALACGVACGGAEPREPPSLPAADADEQLARALAGDLDPEAAAIDQRVRETLGAAAVDALGRIDWPAADARTLLESEPFMAAWSVIAGELAGVRTRHLIAHPQCTFVGNVLDGWAHAVGARLEEDLGAATAGGAGPAVSLYFAKKAAQTFDVPVDEGFVIADHCTDDPGPGCGIRGNACCSGQSCIDGSLCLAGACM